MALTNNEQQRILFMTTMLSKVIELESGCNFRDLGGYVTAEGRIIKPGVLFRSGVMTYFTAADLRKIAELGITTICDLRRSDEREKEPTQWPDDPNAEIVSWDDEPDIEGQGHLAWGSAESPEQIRQSMIALYRAMPFWLENRLRGVFRHLCEGKQPLLFHCAAGKDRTGLTAALILTCLGVERDCILADYEQTNQAVDLEAFTITHKQAGMGLADEQHPFLKMAEPIRHAVLRADADYLKAAFDEIEQRFGSVGNYIDRHLGVGENDKQRLHEQLLVNSNL